MGKKRVIMLAYANGVVIMTVREEVMKNVMERLEEYFC